VGGGEGGAGAPALKSGSGGGPGAGVSGFNGGASGSAAGAEAGGIPVCVSNKLVSLTRIAAERGEGEPFGAATTVIGPSPWPADGLTASQDTLELALHSQSRWAVTCMVATACPAARLEGPLSVTPQRNPPGDTSCVAFEPPQAHAVPQMESRTAQPPVVRRTRRA
jgi:hypothetical protein